MDPPAAAESAALVAKGASLSDSDASSGSGTDGSGPDAQGSRPPRLGVGARLCLGPAGGAALYAGLALWSPAGMARGAQLLAGVTFWIAAWWLTEALPMGVTSLLPVVLFPALGILTRKETVKNYASPLFFLFLGGFQLAFALEKAGVHRRFANGMLGCMGTRPPSIILGVMLCIGLLSMFLSNTATTLMIIPVVKSVASGMDNGPAKAVMLSVAYAASTGGMGTVIGTPPNGVLIGQLSEFGVEVSFVQWLGFAAPLSIIMILLIWLWLVFCIRVSFWDEEGAASAPEEEHAEANLARLKKIVETDPNLRESLQVSIDALQQQVEWSQGRVKVSQAEWRVSIVFVLVVAGWTLRGTALNLLVCGADAAAPVCGIGDEAVAVAATVLLFCVHATGADGRRAPLLDWPTFLKTPWDILLLFGAGLAIADGFKSTGLSGNIGGALASLEGCPTVLLVFCSVLLVTFLTELTSNTATANILLPILGSIACQLGLSPVILMVPAGLACSCAYMLPIATPPNAIAFATKQFTLKDMASTGLFINLGSAVLITLWMQTWGYLCFDMERYTCEA